MTSDYYLPVPACPRSGTGITERPSGISATPTWVAVAAPVSSPVAAVGYFGSGLEHHNQIISGDENRNGVVLRSIRTALRNATTHHD